MKFNESLVQEIIFNNKKLYVKRDDLLSKEFSGNKARKFFYFLKHDFKGINKIISYGSPQANSLYSMSYLAKVKNWDFDFYVNHIPSFLKENPHGNYKEALKNKANIIPCQEDNIHEYIVNNLLNKNSLFIEEGGRVQEASYGIEILAKEIISWAKKEKKDDLIVCLPSGTGTTALFLQKFLPFKVITCACVGSSEYLKKQFFHLQKDESCHPEILQLSKKYHFGKLYKEFYEIYKELLKQTKIEFDLLYDPLGFISLINSKYFHKKTDILYIHQGGILGNYSMLKRYERKLKIE